MQLTQDSIRACNLCGGRSAVSDLIQWLYPCGKLVWQHTDCRRSRPGGKGEHWSREKLLATPRDRRCRRCGGVAKAQALIPIQYRGKRIRWLWFHLDSCPDPRPPGTARKLRAAILLFEAPLPL